MTPTAYRLFDLTQALQTNVRVESHSTDTFDSASESHSIRTHRRFGWRKPATRQEKGKKRRRPPVIDATASALVRGLEQRLGGLYNRLSRHTVIAGYSRERNHKQGRQRRWRSDGVESVLGMLVALVYSADVRTGYIGRPRKGGPYSVHYYGGAGGMTQQGWERYGVEDLARFAYGAADNATIKRAERAMLVIASFGVLTVSAQPRRTTDSGEIRGDVSHRRLNWERLCDLCGTTQLLRKDRSALARKYATPTKPSTPKRPAAALTAAEAAERVVLAKSRIADAIRLLGSDPPITT